MKIKELKLPAFAMLDGCHEKELERDRMNERERIGRRVAEIRKERGYTVRQLAELANLRAATISNVENGKFSVGIDILAKICDALEVKIEII